VGERHEHEHEKTDKNRAQENEEHTIEQKQKQREDDDGPHPSTPSKQQHPAKASTIEPHKSSTTETPCRTRQPLKQTLWKRNPSVAHRTDKRREIHARQTRQTDKNVHTDSDKRGYPPRKRKNTADSTTRPEAHQPPHTRENTTYVRENGGDTNAARALHVHEVALRRRNQTLKLVGTALFSGGRVEEIVFELPSRRRRKAKENLCVRRSSTLVAGVRLFSPNSLSLSASESTRSNTHTPIASQPARMAEHDDRTPTDATASTGHQQLSKPQCSTHTHTHTHTNSSTRQERSTRLVHTTMIVRSLGSIGLTMTGAEEQVQARDGSDPLAKRGEQGRRQHSQKKNAPSNARTRTSEKRKNQTHKSGFLAALRVQLQNQSPSQDGQI
jgi:hypothetical protein